jgi:antitoxin HicB
MTKNLNYYLELKYPLIISEGIENGEPYFEAEIPELSGCGSFGETIEQALERLREAKELWIKARLKRGLPIPEPISEEDFSGKFLLRITPALHRKLAADAKNENLSLNQYIRKVLEERISLNAVLDRLNYLEQRMVGIYRPVEAIQANFPFGIYSAASAVYNEAPCYMGSNLGTLTPSRWQGVAYGSFVETKERGLGGNATQIRRF